MAIPKAVQEQAERAEALMAAQQAAATQQSAPASQGTPSAPPADGSGDAPVAPKGEPAAQPQNQTVAPAAPKSEDWETRHKVLLGKYNAEVPRLAGQLREANQLVNELKARVEALEARPPEPLVKESEVQEFGEPLADFIARVARQEVAPALDQVKAVQGRVSRFESEAARSTEVGYYEALAEAVPDWVVVNDQPEFHEWLKERDSFSGKTRQELLEVADRERDAARVTAFFTAFKKASGRSKADADRKLEEQVVPEQGAPNGAPPAKPVFTRAGIERFYADVRAGKLSAKDAATIEAEIHEAIREGRVR